MPQPALTLENSIRSMRIIYGVLLSAILLCIRAAEKLSHREPLDIRVIWLALLANGLMVVGIALFFRFKMLQPAAETLRAKPDDQAALARWINGNILSSVLAETIALFGFALRFIGGTHSQALPFYVVAIALMLVWWPRRP